MRTISVLLADDHVVVRAGLRALLQLEPGLAVVGEASNGQEAVTVARQLRPSVVVMDVAMPVLNGIEATRQITRELPASRVLVLSTYSDDRTVKEIVQAGAAGYLIKQTCSSDLLRAIHEVHAGNAFFSPTIAARLRDERRQAFTRGKSVADAGRLSPREIEALERIAMGFSNKEIAADLGISTKTVEKHRQQVMNKLNIHDIAGLTRYAVTNGLLRSDSPLGPELAPELNP